MLKVIGFFASLPLAFVAALWVSIALMDWALSGPVTAIHVALFVVCFIPAFLVITAILNWGI